MHTPGLEQFTEFLDTYAPYAGMTRIRLKEFDLSRTAAPLFLCQIYYTLPSGFVKAEVSDRASGKVQRIYPFSLNTAYAASALPSLIIRTGPVQPIPDSA